MGLHNKLVAAAYWYDPEANPGEWTPEIPASKFHALWQELHSEVRTAEQFANWVKRVPSWGCSCASWLREYVAANPPTGDMREYGWRLHNATNAKLNKAFFVWPDFEKMYPNTT